MRVTFQVRSRRMFAVSALGLFLASVHSSAQVIPDMPLAVADQATPLNMLVIGRDHTLFFEAYNDISDVTEDGELDLHFKPTFTYYGYFDPEVCYEHNGGATADGYFRPVAEVVDTAKKECPGSWSGNWLNYVTTARIDALRKVLYGGHRDVDTAEQTIIRRAYIPQDGHSWAKEYTSIEVDGYDIADYTPYAAPIAGRRHFFGNATMNARTNCADLDSCSDLPPLLSVVTNSDRRVWDWASSARPVLANGTHGGVRANFTVRVEVCTEAFHREQCKLYPNGKYKPVGVLHEYGESESVLFGLLTGSYDMNMSGGILRKAISSFTSEVIAESGIFSDVAPIVRSMDSLRIRDFNNGRIDAHYRNGSFRTGIMAEGAYVDWGNPIGEMMYEALRYFAGKKAPTGIFNAAAPIHDNAVGLSPAVWDDPYASDSAAKAPWCAKPSMLVMSSTAISYDSDQLPGSAFLDGMDGDLPGLDVSSLAGQITDGEPDVVGLHFIGAVGANEDFAPTAKMVTTLGSLRGLSPEEPTKQGSFYAASVAYYGNTVDLNPISGPKTGDPDKIDSGQKVRSFAVALASPLPKFEFLLGEKKVTVVPFAKTIDGLGAVRDKGRYQPTNPIVDLYIEEMSNERLKFRVNYEADEQGNDFDMDVIGEYEFVINDDDTLTAVVKVTRQETGSNQNIGYVISGTNRDGVYLVAQDKNENLAYFLNVPPGEDAGFCDVVPMPAQCSLMPFLAADLIPHDFDTSKQRFAAGTGTTATVLKNPLWYAAKWGGFKDSNGNGQPDILTEWHTASGTPVAGEDRMPNTYFPVQNPSKLLQALKDAFKEIANDAQKGVNIAIGGASADGGEYLYQTEIHAKNWEGDLVAYKRGDDGDFSTEPTWKASNGISSAADRHIFTWNKEVEGGVEFSWDVLSDDQKDQLGDVTVLDYIRGDTTNANLTDENKDESLLRYRSRLIGDVVNSSPYYEEHTDTLYFGANDGMLHALNAETGAERFAYIPNLVFDKLAMLADVDYVHKFYVDGEIVISNPEMLSGKRVLVGSPGRGARGLFALDVTNPGSFEEEDVLWEFDAASDATHGVDIGFIIGRPQVATLEDDSKVVVFGNGYNSGSGNSVLFIADLETGEIVRSFVVDVGGGNGMSSPALWDKDINGKIDTIYSGDLKGNVWKFDLSASNPATWNVAYGGLPMFVAEHPDDGRQPITAELLLAQNPDLAVSPVHVFFGTGSYVFDSDPASKQIQTWYSIIDGDARISGRGALKERVFEAKDMLGTKRIRVSSQSIDGDMSGKRGWYLDLLEPGLSPTGERVISQSFLLESIEPVVLVGSGIPLDSDDVCAPEARGYLNFVNAFSGGRFKDDVLDLNGDGLFNRDDQRGGSEGDPDDEGDDVDGDRSSSIDGGVGPTGRVVTGQEGSNQICFGGSTGFGCMNFLPKNIRTGRISWREIVRD